jgi:hypothetical protein
VIDLRFKPLKAWPKEQVPLGGVRDHFKTGWPATLDKLEYELRRLYATHIQIEAGFGPGDLRNDGWPQGGRRPSHPGVILSFVSQEGQLHFPCGNFARYEANIHAIALTLENLRAIDRYGVTLNHQQYAGFAQLAAPESARVMTVEEAAGIIVGIARPQNEMAPQLVSMVLHDKTIFNAYAREAAGMVHPDVAGDRERWDRLEIAKGILEKHHEAAA